MRNKFKKPCYKCGKIVPAHEGYLKDFGKDAASRWGVHCIEECNPNYDPAEAKVKVPKTKEFAVMELGDHEMILPLLEETLRKRRQNKEQVAMLPIIIEYIKGLQAKIKILESTIENR